MQRRQRADRSGLSMDAVAILNRNKGDRSQVAAALSKAGIEASVEAVDGNAIEDRARAAADSGAELVIVGGGDGSISAAAQALAGSKATLGIPRPDDMVRIDGVRQLRVYSARSTITLALDGEALAIRPPLEFSIRPRALRVIVP